MVSFFWDTLYIRFQNLPYFCDLEVKRLAFLYLLCLFLVAWFCQICDILFDVAAITETTAKIKRNLIKLLFILWFRRIPVYISLDILSLEHINKLFNVVLFRLKSKSEMESYDTSFQEKVYKY